GPCFQLLALKSQGRDRNPTQPAADEGKDDEKCQRAAPLASKPRFHDETPFRGRPSRAAQAAAPPCSQERARSRWPRASPCPKDRGAWYADGRCACRWFASRLRRGRNPKGGSAIPRAIQ